MTEFQKKCKMQGFVFLQGSSSNGETLEPFIEIVSEILYTKQVNLDQNQKFIAKMTTAKLEQNQKTRKNIVTYRMLKK